jgi:single-strand DNA-binding protein
MAGYNRIIMVGNLTKDPEIRSVGSTSVCKITIASNRQYKNKQTGNVTQEVCFIDIEVWGTQADTCKTYLQKGRPVLVEGRLKLDSWKDAEGNTKSKHSIVSEKIIFLGSSDNANIDETSDELSSFQQSNESIKIRPEQKFNNNPQEKSLFDEIKTTKKASPQKQKFDNNNETFLAEKELPF